MSGFFFMLRPDEDIDMGMLLKLMLIGTLGYYLIDFFLKYKKLKHIGGPTPIPLTGNLLQQFAIVKTMKYLRITADKFGEIFVFWAGRRPYVVVTDRIAAREVLTNPRVFKKGFLYDDYFSIVFGKGLVTCPFGDRYRRDRSILNRFFSAVHVVKFIPLMNECTHRLIETDCLSPDANLEEFDIDYFFKRLFTHFFMKFAMDYDGENHQPYQDIKDLIRLVSYGSAAIGQSAIFGLPRSPLLNPKIRHVKKEMWRLYAWFDRESEKRLKNRAEGNVDAEPDDIFKALLDSGVGTQVIYDQLTTLISAGHDTSAYFGSYTAYLLAKHPEVQRKVKAEITDVMKGRTTVTADDLSNLKYLSRVLKESLRIYSIIPCLTRSTTEDTVLNTVNQTKLKIPKGTDVMVPLIVMNKNDKIWDKPYKFNPDRFNDIERLHSPKHGYFPFAYGPRHCIGNTLSVTETTVAFVLLLQKASLEQLEDFTPIPTVGISLVSANGMKVRVRLDKQSKAN